LVGTLDNTSWQKHSKYRSAEIAGLDIDRLDNDGLDIVGLEWDIVIAIHNFAAVNYLQQDCSQQTVNSDMGSSTRRGTARAVRASRPTLRTCSLLLELREPRCCYGHVSSVS